MASYSKLKAIASLSAEANVEHDSNEIDLKTKTSISLIADINSNEELPTQYEAVIEYIKKFPKYVEKTNKGKGVPIEIELLPLDYVCRMFDFEVKIEYVINNLNVEIINRFEKEFDSLLKWKRTLYDIIKEVQSNSNLFPDASYSRLLDLQRDLTLSESQLKDRVSNLLYKIRCGKEEESKLTGVLVEYQKSGKAHEIEKELSGKFIRDIKNQIQFINCLRSNDIECIDKSKDLNLHMQTAKNEDVYVFKYDQDLKATNPLVFENNWTYFLMLKRTKPDAKFFIFDYQLNSEDSNQNNRIVINHYKHGHLIESDLVEYLKVELNHSIAKPINHSTSKSLPLEQVTSKSELYELKLPCPNWKTTYGCSTEKLNWKCMKCKEIFVYDSELMFICGCSKVSYQHFGYKCVNSHHPRHPQNEFIKYDNLDELKNYLSSSIKKMTEQIDENKNIEQLIWFDFNIDNGENKLHQTKLKTVFDLMKFHAFKDLNQLEEHLNNSKAIRSLLIVSGSAYQAVFDKFYNLKQISDILIFTSRPREIDMSKYSKVRKLVFSVLELIDCIRNILNNNFETSAKWQWENDFNSFSCYDANISQQIEGFYQHYLKDVSQKMKQLKIKRNDSNTIDNYIFDFEKMCQINDRTKYKRLIKRNIE